MNTVSSLLNLFKITERNYKFMRLLVKLKSILIVSLLSVLVITPSLTFAINDPKELVMQKYIDSLPTAERVYELEPDTRATLPSLGRLDEQFLLDGLKAVNFSRYLAGLPADVTLDEGLNHQAQHGAIVLANIGHLTHYPSKPDGMPEDFFQIGYKSTSSSNLAQGFRSLYDSVTYAYMDDGDPTNIDRVGHRRWILNPMLQKIGFGFADSKVGPFSPMQVFDKSRPVKPSYDYIAFPSNGVMPLEVFESVYNGFPWSISLNPEEYDLTNLFDVSIQVQRKSDQKTWSFNNTQRETTDGSFYIDRGGYGINNCIIFRPNYELKDGDQFTVNISGLRKQNGTSAEVSYSVEFFKAIKSISAKPTKPFFTSEEPKTYKVLATTFNGKTVDLTHIVPITSYHYPDKIEKKRGEVIISNNSRRVNKFSGWISFAGNRTELSFDVLPKNHKVTVSANPFSDADREITGTASPVSVVTAYRTLTDGSLKLIASAKPDYKNNYYLPTKQVAGSKITIIAEDQYGYKDQVRFTVADKTPPVLTIKSAIAKTGIITGKSEAGITIKTTILQKTYTAKTDKNGNFTLKLPKQKPKTKIKFIATDTAKNQNITFVTMK
jgi:uncharacterized protein YkwD